VDGERLDIDEVVPGGRIDVLIIDLRGAKDTRRILADLNACFPATAGPVAAGVREALWPRNAALLARARAAVARGDASPLGALMTEAQHVFDELVAPACPELAAPKLHGVLSHAAVRELAWGGKGVGSQGDGSAQVVTKGPEERRALAERLTPDLDVGWLPLTLGAG